MIRKRYIILLAAALMSVQGACAQNASAEVPRHVVAFYNVEDLFDTEDDPLAADEDMPELEEYVKEYCRLFGYDQKAVMDSPFTVVTPDSRNPYKQMYVAN